MVYIPLPGLTPLDPPPDFDLTAELTELRRQTEWFIELDPVDIMLIPREKTRVPGGGYSTTDLPPRPLQTFKLISQAAFSGMVESGDGVERQYEFILLGKWDSTIHVGDWWEDDTEQRWQVVGMIPDNGYERKAGIHSFGKYPGGG